MKIILKKDIKNLGKKNEVKEVSDGYARNFLIPKKWAEIATPQKIQKAQNELAISIAKAEEELKRCQRLAKNLDGLEIEIPVKTTKEGKLYESINASKIVKILNEKNNIKLEKNQINIAQPIKSIGEYKVIIKFPHNLEAEVKLIITQLKEKN